MPYLKMFQSLLRCAAPTLFMHAARMRMTLLLPLLLHEQALQSEYSCPKERLPSLRCCMMPSLG